MIYVGVTIAGNPNGTAGSSSQTFNGPVDLAFSFDGTLYVADWSNKRVQRFSPGSPNGTTIYATADSPQGLFIDSFSNIYTTWAGTRNQVFIQPIGISVPPTASSVCNWTISLKDAYDVVADNLGNIYVSSATCSYISQWNVNSTNAIRLIASSPVVSQPRHLYLDIANSILYVADTLNHRIVKIFLTGNLTAQTVAGVYGSPGTAANKLTGPCGVCVSRLDGTIYVADTGNNRIQKWSPGGSVGITIAGNSNGTAGSGIYGLNGPYSVILDNTETYIYVADYYNNRVQRFLI